MFEYNAILMSEIASNNIKDELSLSKLEENYRPEKKRHNSFKVLLICIVSIACVGVCFAGPFSNSNKTANAYKIVNNHII